MAKHKLAEYIKAWADGLIVERRISGGNWEVFNDNVHVWAATDRWEYRIKPEPKPDVVRFAHTYIGSDVTFYSTFFRWLHEDKIQEANIKVIFNAETGEPKSVEIINKEK